jgi:TPR repeat protein
MKLFVLVVAAVFFATAASAQIQGIPDFERSDNLEPEVEMMYRREASGLKQYNRDNYERAFELLSETAVQGLKKSQYILAFMFLKGEYVDKNLLLGMAWMGVAKESKEKEWVEQYDNLYAKFNDAQQAMVDAKVNQYIERYGLKATRVTCEKLQAAGSRVIETRCIKLGTPNSDPIPVELTL